jgi:hypothetical protein
MEAYSVGTPLSKPTGSGRRPSGPAAAAIRLDYSRPRYRNFALLEGYDGQHCKGVEQFAGTEQKIGVMRAPEPLVAAGEGLVNHYTTAGEGFGDRRQQRTVQIIGHDNAIIAGTEHPWGAGLEIDLPHLAADSGQRRQRRDVAVDRAKPQSRSRA